MKTIERTSTAFILLSEETQVEPLKIILRPDKNGLFNGKAGVIVGLADKWGDNRSAFNRLRDLIVIGDTGIKNVVDGIWILNTRATVVDGCHVTGCTGWGMRATNVWNLGLVGTTLAYNKTGQLLLTSTVKGNESTHGVQSSACRFEGENPVFCEAGNQFDMSATHCHGQRNKNLKNPLQNRQLWPTVAAVKFGPSWIGPNNLNSNTMGWCQSAVAGVHSDMMINHNFIERMSNIEES